MNERSLTSTIRHWFLNFEEWASEISSPGYSLELKTFVNSERLNTRDVLPMENFPKSHRIKDRFILEEVE